MPFRLVVTERGLPVYETHARYSSLETAKRAGQTWLEQCPKGSVLVLEEIGVLKTDFVHKWLPPPERM